MSLNDLMPELLKLNRDEMIQAIEILKRQVNSKEQTQIAENVSYEVWSPSITPETASILREVLKEDKAKHG
jgi:hypothetical protein